MNTAIRDRLAFGSPGIEPRWTRGNKDAVGTAYSSSSRVWFTLTAGVLSEVYYPLAIKQPGKRCPASERAAATTFPRMACNPTGIALGLAKSAWFPRSKRCAQSLKESGSRRPSDRARLLGAVIPCERRRGEYCVRGIVIRGIVAKNDIA